MLGVVQAVGIDEVGVFAPQLCRPGVHGVHKGAHAAADTLGQHVAGLVGGDDQHALEVVFHRHGLAHLDPGGAAVGGQPVQRGGGGGQLLIQRQLPLIHGLQRQQRGHDLGQAGGIQLGVFIFGVERRLRVPVHQKRRLGLNVRVRDRRFRLVRRGGDRGEAREDGQQQKNREKAFEFHVNLLHYMV